MKKSYIDNYIKGLTFLHNEFSVEEIMDAYGATLVKINCDYNIAKRHRDTMEDLGWELIKPQSFEPLITVWRFHTGPVTR